MNEGLKSLDLAAFSLCKNLKKIILPSSVETVRINEVAFKYDYDDDELLCMGNIGKCIENVEVYSREINTRFINDINYHSYKSDDELIDELCSKYPYIKRELLDLVRVKFKIGEYADKDIDFEDEYSYFIRYCNNNIFALNNSQTIKSSNNKLSVSNHLVDEFVPWYWMGQSNLSNKKEYDNLKNDVPRAISELVTDDELSLLEELGIKKDKFGYWYKDDIIPKSKVEDMKRLARTNNYRNPS